MSKVEETKRQTGEGTQGNFQAGQEAPTRKEMETSITKPWIIRGKIATPTGAADTTSTDNNQDQS